MGYNQLGVLELISSPKIGFTFKQRPQHFANARATDVVVVKLFIKFYNARESNDRQTFDWMNSIKFRASLCQTLDVSNSKRMPQCLRYDFELPIEKYIKLLNQAYLARRRCCQILRRFFSLQEKGMTVKLSMGRIESNPKLPLKANIRRI